MSFLLKLNKVFIKNFQFCLCLKHAKLQILHCFFTSLRIISIEAQPFSSLKAWKIDFNCISLNASASDLTHTMGNSTGMIVFPLSHSSFGLCNRKQKYYCKLAVLGVALANRPDGAGALEFTRLGSRVARSFVLWQLLRCSRLLSRSSPIWSEKHYFDTTSNKNQSINSVAQNIN